MKITVKKLKNIVREIASKTLDRGPDKVPELPWEKALTKPAKRPEKRTLKKISEGLQAGVDVSHLYDVDNIHFTISECELEVFEGGEPTYVTLANCQFAVENGQLTASGCRGVIDSQTGRLIPISTDEINQMLQMCSDGCLASIIEEGLNSFDAPGAGMADYTFDQMKDKRFE